MGTTSQKLSYLNDTKGKLKDSINKFRDGIIDQTKFRDYATELDGIYDKLPKVDNTSDASRLLNAQNGLLDDFKMYGNTQQDTYTGKNKYAITSATGYSYSNSLPAASSNNMVIDSYDLSNITFHTAGNQYLLTLLPIFTLEPNTSYIINYTRSNNLITNVTPRRWIYAVDSSNNYSLIQQYFEDDGFQAYQFTTGTTGKIAIAFGFSNNSSGSSSTVNNLMIRLATESDGTFEPYVGGTSSPNPDYPQNINVVSGNQVVNVSGKNLFNTFVSHQAGYTVTNNGITYTLNTDGTITANGTNTSNAVFEIAGSWNNTTKLIDLDSSKTYKLSEENNRVVYVRSITGTTLSTHNSTNETTSVISGKEGLGYIGVELAPGTYNNIIIKPQLEEGSTATTYEPYQSQDYEIDLLDYELCKIEDYKDVIFKNNQLSEHYDSTLDEDSWYIKKEISKVVLDGSESWTFGHDNTSTGYAYFYTSTYDSLIKQEASATNHLCNRLTPVNQIYTNYNDNGNNIATGQSSSNKTRIAINTANSVIELTSWLSNNNVILYFILATPTYEKITNETLISQLESIKVNTGSNYFTLSNSNNVLPNIYAKRLKKLDSLT